MDVRGRIRECGIVPVVAIARAQEGPRLGAALTEGGLPCAEITLRTPAGIEAIRLMRLAQPDLLVGAGTVLTTEQASRAMDAGAQFIVMPGFGADVVALCVQRAIPVYPGVVTPTEVMRALDAGISDVKFFPASTSGGSAHLRALAGPFASVSFLPTGGIGLTELSAYLAIRSVLAVGGSWMVKPELLDAGAWATVTTLAAEAVAVVRSARPPVVAPSGQPA